MLHNIIVKILLDLVLFPTHSLVVFLLSFLLVVELDLVDGLLELELFPLKIVYFVP